MYLRCELNELHSLQQLRVYLERIHRLEVGSVLNVSTLCSLLAVT